MPPTPAPRSGRRPALVSLVTFGVLVAIRVMSWVAGQEATGETGRSRLETGQRHKALPSFG